MDREYLTRLPKALPQDGRVLVHNTIRPVTRRQGWRGSRYWLQSADDTLEPCNCGFAPELGQHHRVRSASPTGGMA
jgi:hypothetical protein